MQHAVKCEVLLRAETRCGAVGRADDLAPGAGLGPWFPPYRRGLVTERTVAYLPVPSTGAVPVPLCVSTTGRLRANKSLEPTAFSVVERGQFSCVSCARCARKRPWRRLTSSVGRTFAICAIRDYTASLYVL